MQSNLVHKITYIIFGSFALSSDNLSVIDRCQETRANEHFYIGEEYWIARVVENLLINKNTRFAAVFGTNNCIVRFKKLFVELKNWLFCKY